MGMNECVQHVRDIFLKKYAENVASGMYDARDLIKLQSDSTFVKAYISAEDKLDEAVDYLHTSLKFKKEMNVHDVSESSFEREMLELGGMFYHGRNINGNRMLWMKAKFHRRDFSLDRQAMEKLGIIYAIERAFCESPLQKIIILVDMTSCGMANVDIDLAKFIANIIRLYYPTFVEYVLIYDMPWIFNAAWRILKAWMGPEIVSRMKFSTKSDIQTYVKAQDLPPYMGGTDEFKFIYTPSLFTDALYPEEDDSNNWKKVHFQEVQEYSSNVPGSEIQRSIFDCDLFPSDANSNSQDGLRNRINNQKQLHIYGNFNNSAIDRKHKMEGFSGPGGLYISPPEELAFQIRDTGDSFDIITLTNTLPHPVAFKVKTTTPEKFRVRPSTGLIKPDKTEEVYVYLVPDQSWDVTKDKFLIMAMDARGEGPDLNQVFRDAPKEKIMQHKMKCTIVYQENQQKMGRPGEYGDQKMGRHAEYAEKACHNLLPLKPDSGFSQVCSSYEVPVGVLPMSNQDFLQLPGQGSLQRQYHCVGQDSARIPYLGHMQIPGQGFQQMPGQNIYHIPGQMPNQNGFQAASQMPAQGAYYLNGQDYMQAPGQGSMAIGNQVSPQAAAQYFSHRNSSSHVPEDVNPTDVCETKTRNSDDLDKQVEQLEQQTRHMQKQLNVLLVIQFLTAFTLLLVMLSYSCFGEDLFTHFLALPFDFCHDTYGRKC